MNYLWENIFKKSQRENDIRGTLRKNILFQDLNERELKFLETMIHVRKYRAGEPIFRQGELGIGMYLIVKGRVEIFVTDEPAPNEENREIFITQLTRSDFFGELSLVEDSGRRTASAIAREETTLIGFFKPDLMEIRSRSPAVGTKIMMRLAEVLGKRLKETTEKVSDLRRALKDVRQPTPLDGPHGNKASSDTPA